MSTITKLDPLVRQQRTERATSRKFFRSQSRYNTDLGAMCITIAGALDRLIKNPSHSGAVKHAVAQRIERQFEAIMAALEAKREEFTQASTPVTGI
jgi:hypothetical protein